jgi:hypothetical protein
MFLLITFLLEMTEVKKNRYMYPLASLLLLLFYKIVVQATYTERSGKKWTVLIHISGFQSFPTKMVINKNIRFSFQDGGICLHFVGYEAVLIPSPGCFHFLKEPLYMPEQRYSRMTVEKIDFMVNNNNSDLHCLGIEPGSPVTQWELYLLNTGWCIYGNSL